VCEQNLRGDEKVSVAAWETKPSWAIVTEQDHMIDPILLRDMAAKIKAKTTSLQASHVPMLSKPQEVADVIIDAANSVK
jgi:pimeloyl-ACP methyl ester carboxylesterase